MAYPSNDAPVDQRLDAGEEILQFIQRWEHLQVEKQEIADQQKEIMAEAKGRGYDTKVIKKLIAKRKRDKDDLAEEEAVMEMYEAAILAVEHATLEAI